MLLSAFKLLSQQNFPITMWFTRAVETKCKTVEQQFIDTQISHCGEDKFQNLDNTWYVCAIKNTDVYVKKLIPLLTKRTTCCSFTCPLEKSLAADSHH
jgi:hypothetical protein